MMRLQKVYKWIPLDNYVFLPTLRLGKQDLANAFPKFNIF